MSSSLIGKVVGNYRIIENLGIGGMGVVFKAIHIKHGKLFALKMLVPGLAMDEHFIKNFLIAAKALARIEDPNIVRIYDLKSEDDHSFIVMEYVDGFNLLELIREDGAFPLQNALEILKQILLAIGHAHKAGLIHRNIKPNNILISTDGKVKITDFGLAKVKNILTTTPYDTSAAGLYYMSPEHVRGYQFTDKRSDIYSIGMVFYQLVTGTLPFKNIESDFDLRESIIKKRIIKPRTYNRDIPPALETIVMKSIAKSPEDRYQSTKQMLHAIHKFETRDSKIDTQFALVEFPESTDIEKVIHPESVQAANKKIISTLVNFNPLNKPNLIRLGVYGSLITLLFIIMVGLFSDYPPADSIKNSFLTITSEPSSAFVILGDDSIGHTPLENQALQPGTYSLTIGKNNFASVDSNIVLKSGLSLNLYFSLGPIKTNNKKFDNKIKSASKPMAIKNTILPAHLIINSDPRDAAVYMNGMLKGKTPLSINNLLPGNYRLEFKKEGFERYIERIKLDPGSKKQLKAILSPDTGSLFVSTQPESATIFIDEKEVVDSKTPLTIENIATGKHKIKIQKKGYALLTKEVEIEKGKRIKTDFELEELRGKLSVQIRPWGSIYINDELRKEFADTKYEVTLPAEPCKLTIIHPTLGKWEKIVDITSDKEAEILINFNQEIYLNVIAEDEYGLPLSGEIYIDNIPTGKSTPAEVVTREGLHILTVRKEGYVSLTDKNEICVDENSEMQHKIILKKND